MDEISSAQHLSDEVLALRVAEGSRTSFEELVSRYSPRLLYFLRYRTETDQDIEDVIQETFLKAFRNIDRFNPERKFSTWLYTIAVRQAISRYRSNKTEKAKLPAKPNIPGPEETVIQREESQNLWKHASSLSQKEFEALWLHYAEDMPVKEIAKITKKKAITVRVLLHRARLNLAKRINRSTSAENQAGTAPAEHKFSFL